MLPQCLQLSFSSIQLMVLEEMSKKWKANDGRTTTTDNRPWHKLTWSKVPGELIIIIIIMTMIMIIIITSTYILRIFSHSQTRRRLRGGLVGCAVRLETRRSRVQPPPKSATFFRGEWSWNIFYGHSLPSADSRRAVVSFWRKNVHNTG